MTGYIPDGESFSNVKHFFYSYITDPELREIIDNKQYGIIKHPSIWTDLQRTAKQF